MHTKSFTAVSTAVTYCLILVAYFSGVAYAEVTVPSTATWNLTAFATRVASVITLPEIEPVVEAPSKPAPKRFIARGPKWRVPTATPQRAAAPRTSAPRERAAAPSSPLGADPVIVTTILEFNGDISVQAADRLGQMIETTADEYGVDPYLVTALVSQESAFYQSAMSPVGAMGLGQLMPETAAELGVNPKSSRENLDGCVRYLAQNLDAWSGSEDPIALALASYNAGAGNVEHYGGVPPFEETQNYVAIIKARYNVLRNGQAVSAA